MSDDLKFKLGFFGFFGACMAVILAVGAFVIIREIRGVECHHRVRSDDRCFQELEEKVVELERRVTILEKR